MGLFLSFTKSVLADMVSNNIMYFFSGLVFALDSMKGQRDGSHQHLAWAGQEGGEDQGRVQTGSPFVYADRLVMIRGGIEILFFAMISYWRV